MMTSLSNSSGRQPSSTVSGDTPDNSSTLSGSNVSGEINTDRKEGFCFADFCRRVSLKIQQLTPPQVRPSDEDIERELKTCIAKTQERSKSLRTHWLKFDTFHGRDDPTFTHLAECTPEQCLCFQAALVLPGQPHLLKIEGLSDLWICAPGCICQIRGSVKNLVALTDLRDSNPVTSPQQARERILAFFKSCHSVEEAVDIKLRLGLSDLTFLRHKGFCDYRKKMSSSSGTPESWISSFCSLLGHEYFAEISEDFIEDDFNLTGLQTQVAMYKEALEMILDVEPEEDEDEDEDEEEDEGEESIEGEDRTTSRAARERRHHRMASDLSIIESSAEMLYGLIHQRFICSRAGIQQMSEKYELAHFGVCPRTFCDQVRTLPVGLSDVPGEDTVKLFCPSCLDVYVPPNSRFQTVDGAFFGRTFGALFLLTFPEYDISKKGADTLAAGRQIPAVHTPDGEEKEKINGFYANNLAPGLGRGKVYEPKIYGFKVSERARSGPRMSWLRKRPLNVAELDEATIYAAEHGEESEEDGGVNGVPTSRRRLAPPNRPRTNGSPMSIEATNGDTYA